jgi:hypothetical protein
MKNMRFYCFAVVLILLLQNSIGQDFVNLDFEDSIITSSQPSFQGFNYGTANVPGWVEYNGWSDSNYAGGASLIYNNQTLDNPDVSIWDTTYFRPAIEGDYSVYLYGGSAAYALTYPGWPTGASISQTGQIPATAKSISFEGYGFQVSFNGQLLSFTGGSADISAFAGQTGELVFAVPWQSQGVLDDIQFSTQPVPEPSFFGLLALGCVLFGLRRAN